MAETRTQTSDREQREQRGERGIQRREEYLPSRDIFGFSPFSMMRRLSDEMDRAFASTFGLGRTTGGAGWMPPVEVRERDNNLEITAELPGMNKDDVKVECTDEGLIIEGEKKREKETTEGGFHRSERSYGHFYRVIPLPEGADADKAKAEFKDGVLRVQVPLPEQRRKSRQIPIGT
jgi:HSP20 family protein